MRNMLNTSSTLGNSTVRPIVKLTICNSILRSVCARLAHCLCLWTTQHLGDLRLALRHWPTGMSGLKPAMAVCSVITEHRRRRPITRRPSVG